MQPRNLGAEVRRPHRLLDRHGPHHARTDNLLDPNSCIDLGARVVARSTWRGCTTGTVEAEICARNGQVGGAPFCGFRTLNIIVNAAAVCDTRWDKALGRTTFIGWRAGFGIHIDYSGLVGGQPPADFNCANPIYQAGGQYGGDGSRTETETDFQISCESVFLVLDNPRVFFSISVA